MITLYSKESDSEITLELVGYEFPNSEDAHDKEWIIGNIKFKNRIVNFEIINRPIFYFSELNQFQIKTEEMLNNNSGIVIYSGMEPYLSLEIKLNATGTALIKGSVWYVDSNSAKIEFQFETDQTCITSFLNDLKHDLKLLK